MARVRLDRRKLTPEQEAEVVRRYTLWRENCPKRIAHDFGINPNTLNNIVARAQAPRSKA